MEKTILVFSQGRLLPLRKMLLIMKLSFLFLWIALQVSATNHAQGTISIHAENIHLPKVFDKIEEQTKYRFFYSNEDFQPDQLIFINAQNATITQVLKKILKDTDVKWKIINDSKVVLYKTKEQLLEQVMMEIKGVVKNAAGLPIEGASITVKGSSVGTVTNAAGEFGIEAAEGGVLIISAVGYQEQEVVINNASLNIVLETAENKMEEVVVVGYGTQKKINLTGAVAQVTSEQIENRPVTNTVNALQGVLPGVVVIQNNGQPGKDAGSIRVRGIGTLNNSNPLVVVDGAISSMNAVNPSDIESISVLKDAASSAIYGSTAGNGVVLITTKKGKGGKPVITYDAYVGKQKPTALPDFLPSWQAATLFNQARVNQGVSEFYTDEQIQKFKDGSDPYNYPNTDWLDLFYRGDGLQHNHYLSFSGGSDATRYLFSLGYFDQNGIVEKTNAKRYTSRLNLSSKINKKITLSANLSYTYAPLDEPSNPYTSNFSQFFRQINRISPIIPYKHENGHYGFVTDGSPMAWLDKGGFNKELNTMFLGIVGLTYEPVDNLHVKPQLVYRTTQDQNKKRIYEIQYYHADGNPGLLQGPSKLTDHFDNTTFLSPQLTIDYGKQINNHNFMILGGAVSEYTKYAEQEAYRQNFLNNKLDVINAGSTEGQTAAGYAYELAKQSFFGRLTYDFNSKYLFEANIRYDGCI